MTIWLPGIFFSAFFAFIFGYVFLRSKQYAVEEKSLELNALFVQLNRVESEIQNNQISAAEGEKLKNEIGREILIASKKFEAKPKLDTLSKKYSPILAIGIGALVFVGSQSLLSYLGSPGYEDQPIKERLEKSQQLRQNKLSLSEVYSEISGMDFNTQVELALEPIQELKTEYSHDPVELLIRLDNEFRDSFLELNYLQAWVYKREFIEQLEQEISLQDYVELLDTTILLSNLYITPEAEKLISQILLTDSENYTANFYNGLMYSQIDRPDRTFAIWNKLLSNFPESINPWSDFIEANILEVATKAGIQ